MSKTPLPSFRFPVLASFALLSVLSAGCCKKGGSDATPAGGDTTAPAPAQSGHHLGHGKPVAAALEIAKTGTSFTPPSGWEQEQKNEWTIVHVPPDASGNIEAMITFVTFNKPNESTRKLGALTGTFGLTNIRWGEREFLELPAGFPATGAGGTCKDETGRPCEIHYLTINPGGSEQILFVYMADADKMATYKDRVAASLKSLKKG